MNKSLDKNIKIKPISTNMCLKNDKRFMFDMNDFALDTNGGNDEQTQRGSINDSIAAILPSLTIGNKQNNLFKAKENKKRVHLLEDIGLLPHTKRCRLSEIEWNCKKQKE